MSTDVCSWNNITVKSEDVEAQRERERRLARR
jgi:hypothetical protein